MMLLAFKSLHDFVTEGSQPTILRDDRTVTELIGRVVGQLDHPDAEAREDLDTDGSPYPPWRHSESRR